MKQVNIFSGVYPEISAIEYHVLKKAINDEMSINFSMDEFDATIEVRKNTKFLYGVFAMYNVFEILLNFIAIQT